MYLEKWRTLLREGRPYIFPDEVDCFDDNIGVS